MKQKIFLLLRLIQTIIPPSYPPITIIINNTTVCFTYFYVGIVADIQKIIYFCFQNKSKCQFYKYLIRW